MATHYHESGQLPDGIVVAHTLHGRPDESVTNAFNAPHAGLDVQPAPYSGVPYFEDPLPVLSTPPPPPPPVVFAPPVVTQRADLVVEAPEPAPAPAPPPRVVDRAKRCAAKDDTCMGWKVGGSDYCMRHDPTLQASMAERRAAKAAKDAS